MMKALFTKSVLPVLALAVLFAAQPVFAGAPYAPQRLVADNIVQTNTGFDVSLYWWQNMQSNPASLFEIYQADSKTTDLTLFVKVGELTQAEIDSFRTGSGMFFFRVSGLAAGEYSYYVTATNQDGTSPESNIVHVNTSNVSTRVKFTTTPTAKADPNGLYVYDADAEATNNGTVKYKTLQVPNGTSLDENTGELRYTFTPNTFPYVTFSIQAYLDSDPTINAVQTWVVRFGKDSTNNPRVCTVVRGSVVDQNGDPLHDGAVHMLQWTSNGYYAPVSSGKVTPNGYIIESHTSGKFTLMIDGQFIVPEYYENAADVQNAQEFNTQCGDTVVANFVVQTKDAVWFTTQPPMQGDPNGQYTYDADAASNVTDSIKFKAVNLPTGATLDEITGDVSYTYTPNSSGSVTFEIAAYLINDPSVEATQRWTVRFANTNTPRYCMFFTGRVEDENGQGVPEGTVTALWLDSRTGGVIGIPFVGKILPGGYYEVVVYNPGKYVLQANGQTFAMEYYEDAADLQSATVFDVACGDTVTANFVVDALDYYTISGKVTDKATGLGMAARVVAYSTPNAANAGFSTNADASGNYILTVAEGNGYYVRAMDLNGDYFTQYYDHASSQTAATAIDVHSDKTGINFELEKKPVRQNRITGTLTDDSNSPVVGIVVAHKIEYRANIPYPSMMYKTVTDSTGLFEFTNLEPGEYVLQAIQCQAGYAPGYYRDGDFAVVSWLDATRLTVTDNSILYNIVFKLKKTTGLRGSHTFMGNIRGKVGGFNGGEVVLENVMVLLIDESGKISDWSLSDESGNFIMTNAATGRYTLTADVPGYQLYEEEIDLDYSNNEPVIQGIILIPLSLTSVDTPAPVASAIAVNVYPNPAVNIVNVQFRDAVTHATAKLYNALGVLVASESVNNAAAGTNVSFSASALPAGSYYLRITAGTTTTAVALQIVK